MNRIHGVEVDRQERSERATVTVIVPNYNHAHYLPQALGALMAQTRLPDEIIVIDDASNDNSAEVIEQLAEGSSIFHIVGHKRRIGVNATCNEGLTLAKSDFVMFAAADDLLMPAFFERTLALLESSLDAGLCSSRTWLITDQGVRVGELRLPPVSASPCAMTPAEARRKLYRYGSWFLGNTTVFNRSALATLGGFPKDLGSYADGFISMMLAARFGACFIPELLACWRREESGYAGRSMADPGEVERIIGASKRAISAQYSDYLSEEEIVRWEKRLRYSALMSGLRNTSVDSQTKEQMCRNSLKSSRSIFVLVGKLLGFQSRIATIFAFLLLRPFDILRFVSFRPHVIGNDGRSQN